MAKFKKEIQNIYGTDTYESTKKTYDWIVKALYKAALPNLEIEAEFQFKVSEIICVCYGVAEFTENAYGQKDYSFTMFHLSVRSKDTRVYIIVDSFDRITISTESKVILEQIVNIIQTTSVDAPEVDEALSVTYIETQINNDGVIVNGDNNIVANNHSEVEVEKEKKESGFKAFWNGVFQNVASNFLWYLLTLAAGGLLTYFLTN